MAAVIEINLASIEDTPALAEINKRAYQGEIISRFAWKDGTDEVKSGFYRSRIEERFKDPDAQIYKATTPGTGIVLGFICLTLEHKAKDAAQILDKPPPKMTPSAVVMQQVITHMNLDFVTKTSADMEELRRSTIDGDEHYYVSSFAVDPSHQGQGIGTQLLKHCLDTADESSLRTWLVAFPGSHSLYLRCGFKDVKTLDLDLNIWDNYRFRGYGIYRQSVMVREPPHH